MKRNSRQQSSGSKWQCVSSCGACCNLDPTERPDLAKYLSEDELATYMSMVGSDGWCINYDHDNRKCQIYEQRPRFCRVQPDTFKSMFGVEATDFNEFAIVCCQQQIAGVYGASSPELEHYEQEVTPG
ncbi:MAG: YkgJ family cysteine cluster protein [Cyanobacteria bacterium J06621_12]